ncbi:MAG: VanZ family protein [Clostridia bacterium]
MKRSFAIYLILLCIVLASMFYSSSTPYQKQDIRGNISEVVDASQVNQLLGSISFEYGKKVISVKTVGEAGLIEFFIRKATHFLTFALLAFLFYHVLRRWAEPWTALPWSGFLALACAILDEWHQSFTPNRTAMIEDVILDGVGACLMLAIIMLQRKIQVRRK